MTTTITAQQIIDLGGREWIGRNGQRRIYLNNWHELAGREIVRCKSGSIRWASSGDQPISNTKAAVLAGAKVWFEPETGGLRTTIHRAAADAPNDDVADS